MFIKTSRNFSSGTVSVLLVKAGNIVEMQAVRWIDGLDNAGNDGVGNDDLGAKPGVEDGSNWDAQTRWMKRSFSRLNWP